MKKEFDFKPVILLLIVLGVISLITTALAVRFILWPLAAKGWSYIKDDVLRVLPLPEIFG